MAVQSRRVTYLQKNKFSCAFCCQAPLKFPQKSVQSCQVISKAVFKFYPSTFYLLDKTFNHSVPKPLKIWYINESWRAGLVSCPQHFVCSISGYLLSKILHPLNQSLVTLISGVYNSEEQFSASCKVVLGGGYSSTSQVASQWKSCRYVPSFASCLCFPTEFYCVGKTPSEGQDTVPF